MPLTKKKKTKKKALKRQMLPRIPKIRKPKLSKTFVKQLIRYRQLRCGVEDWDAGTEWSYPEYTILTYIDDKRFNELLDLREGKRDKGHNVLFEINDALVKIAGLANILNGVGLTDEHPVIQKLMLKGMLTDDVDEVRFAITRLPIDYRYCLLNLEVVSNKAYFSFYMYPKSIKEEVEADE